MYLKEGLRSKNVIDSKIFAIAIKLDSGNIELIKEDQNNFTDTKVTKEEIEKLYSLNLESKIGFLLMIGSRRKDSKLELIDLKIDAKLNDCPSVDEIIFPYTFIIFDRLGLGILRPHVFSYPKYPIELYNWQYEPTASNVDIWTKETLRLLVFFPSSCASQNRFPLKIEITDKEKNRNSFSFEY